MDLSPAFDSYDIPIAGKTYKITPFLIAARMMFHAYLKRAAVADVVLLREAWGKEEFPAAKAEVSARCAAGYYEWNGDGFRESLQSHRHVQELAIINMQQTHGTDAPTLEVLARHWDNASSEDLIGPDGEPIKVDGKPIKMTLGQLIFKHMWAIINRPNSQGQGKPAAAALAES